MPPALSLQGLEIRLRRGFSKSRVVLSGIELEVAQGEGLGLVGPNGSGKSTLLRVAAGLERAPRGTVRVFGKDVDSPEARARLGYLPDGFPFPEELSAPSALELLGALHGLGKGERRRRATVLLERLGLTREARTPLGRYSLGMKRRFALSQALLHEPDLLLLDEPSAGLDAEGTVVLEELLDEAQARGAALVWATHVVTELEARCARAMVLVGGRLVASARPGELDRARLLALYRAHARGEPCSR